jgi:23S rRNA pseudouridine2604 synthase
VTALGSHQFKIILTQGLNRQIRRMCEALGTEVKALKRIRIMNLTLDLPVGKWRPLTQSELSALNELLKDSAKTAD